MIASLALIAAPLFAPDSIPSPPTRAWLVGAWLMSAEQSDAAADAEGVMCSTDFGIVHYDADGTSSDDHEITRWRLRDNKIEETLIAIIPDDRDPRGPKDRIGRRFTITIRRIGPREMQYRVPGNRWERALKCPPYEADQP